MKDMKTATPRQLWALYCITKQDYRDKNLTYDEASELIQKLGNKDYKKVSAKKDSLEDEFLAYFKESIMPNVVAELKDALGIASIVEEDLDWMKGSGPDGTAKKYVFRGFGCGFNFLEYDKRSKKGKTIEEIAKNLRYKKCRDLVLAEFPMKLRKALEAEGNPIEAIYSQDINVGGRFMWGVAHFMESKGVKNVSVRSMLD